MLFRLDHPLLLAQLLHFIVLEVPYTSLSIPFSTGTFHLMTSILCAG